MFLDELPEALLVELQVLAQVTQRGEQVLRLTRFDRGWLRQLGSVGPGEQQQCLSTVYCTRTMPDARDPAPMPACVDAAYKGEYQGKVCERGRADAATRREASRKERAVQFCACSLWEAERSARGD